jgi:hypothetical protein
MDPGDPTTPQRERRFQFDLRTLLAVTAIVAVASAMIVRAGPLEVLIAGVLSIPIVVVAVCAWSRCSWLIGLVFVMALAVAATPPDPASMLIFAIPASVVYAVSVLAWRTMRKRRIG